MIRDRIVVGIRDLALSERLQLDTDLTLDKAKTMVCQRVAVHQQQELLKKDFKKKLTLIKFTAGNLRKLTRNRFTDLLAQRPNLPQRGRTNKDLRGSSRVVQ